MAERFVAQLDKHSYQVAETPDEKFSSENQVPLTKILSDMNAPLPGFAGSRCGPQFPEDIVTRLNTAIWEPRGSGPGTQGRTAGKANP